MHIRNCEHPIRLHINGEIVYVGCGKCPVCRNQRHFVWSQRLDEESRVNKYTFFFTLTYNDDFVPRFYKYDEIVNTLTGECDYDSHLSGSLIDLSSNLIIENFDNWFYEQLSKIPEKEKREREKEYFDRYDNFCYPRFSDVSDLFKRLRTHYDRLGIQRPFRYFVAAEIGPNTHRIHYHGLLWISNDYVARTAEELIRRFWSKCVRVENGFVYVPYCDSSRLDWQASFGYAQRYVSKYVTGDTSLPLVYQHPSLQTRFVCSKRPSIGRTTFSQTDFELFSECVTKVRKLPNVDKPPVDVPLFKSLKSRCFPKCIKYSEISHYGRVRSYFALYYLLTENWSFVKNGRLNLPNYQFFELAFIDLMQRYVSLEPEYVSAKDFVFRFRHYKISPTTLFLDLIEPQKSENGFYFVTRNQIRKLYFLSAYSLRFCFEHNLSFSDYVTQIENFYTKLDYELLVNQLNFESEYAKNYDVKDLILLFPDFLNRVFESSMTENTFLFRDVQIESFCIDFNSLWRKADKIKGDHFGFYKVPDKMYHLLHGTTCRPSPAFFKLLDFRKTADFQHMKINAHKIWKDKADKVKRNEYFEVKQNLINKRIF